LPEARDGSERHRASYDEEVNRYLNVAPEQEQVMSHFAIGYPVRDSRLHA